MLLAGIKPQEVYQGTETANGKVAVGTRGFDSNGKEYIFCLVAASQNLVTGNLVTLISTGTGANFGTVTILGTGGAAPGLGTPLGVCVSSITASASSYIWVQVYGSCNVSITDATASNLPGHLVIPASVSGAVRASGVATASSFIEGLVFTATASTGSTGAMFLSYPRLTAA